MGEHFGTKDGEQYPLLKVDSGGSDGSTRIADSPPCVITSVGLIDRTTKQSAWADRWPEFVSACWITFILIGISFLAFYSLGTNAYRRQSLIINKCNASNQVSTVFYCHIVTRGSYVSFNVYSEYISSVAMQYPSLYINVLFLMDDSTQTPIQGPRHTRLFNKLIQSTTDSILDQKNKREIRNVQKNYPNVNISIIPLSKYMAQTPHRYKWRTIPLYFLNFYVRVFTVWQYGGISMDLSTYNNIFNMRQHLDRRISAILKQHNDGIVNERYVNTLKKINEEEQNEFFAMFYLLIHHVLNETCSFFNRSLWYNVETGPTITLNKSSIRSQRNKRDCHEKYERGETDLYQEAIGSTITMKNASHTTESNVNLTSSAKYTINITYSNTQAAVLEMINELTNKTFNTENSTHVHNVTKQPLTVGLDKVYNYSDIHDEIVPNVFFYDVSILTDNIPFPSEFVNMPKPFNHIDLYERITENVNTAEHFAINLPVLTISADGTFVAAPSKYHPMLAYLLSFGCNRVSPLFAINRALMSQCTGIFKNEMYCDNIYVL